MHSIYITRPQWVNVRNVATFLGTLMTILHDDVIKWEHFPRYWPFVQGTHRSPVNSPHKGKWRGALMFFFIYAWINGWENNQEAGDLRCHHTHYDITVIEWHHLASKENVFYFVANIEPADCLALLGTKAAADTVSLHEYDLRTYVTDWHIEGERKYDIFKCFLLNENLWI